VTAGSLSTATSGRVTSTFAGGVWTASGALADVNTLLAGVSFNPALNYNSNFSIATSVSDATSTIAGTKNMTGIAVDDAPVLTSGSTLNYTENDPATAIDTLITVNDVDNATLASATVAITGNYASGEDVLGFVNGAGMGNISGSWNAGTGGLTLSSAGATATTAEWQTALQAVSYSNTTDNPSALVRTVSYTVNDGAANSNTVSSTVNVAPVNDAPVLVNNTLTITGGSSVIFSSANLSAMDVDNPASSLIFTMSNLSNGHFELVSSPGVSITTFTQADITGGLVRFVDTNNTSAPTFDVTVSDGALSVGPNGATIVFSMVAGGGGPVIAPPPIVVPPPAPNPVLTADGGRSGDGRGTRRGRGSTTFPGCSEGSESKP
jgi:Cadherin-like